MLGRGETGEFQTRGYSVMIGYWEDPSGPRRRSTATAGCTPAIRRRWTTSGYLKIVGRIKDMVIRGGENVYPREVEEYLLGHPDVLDAQVVGVPDERFGEELCAWVRLRDGAGCEPDDLREYCKGRIAHYKVPRYVRPSTSSR